VKVTNLKNDKSCVVRINDRGPHTRGRLIDVSREAAERLGMLGSGTARGAYRPSTTDGALTILLWPIYR
jgi:rare lipoprotein A